MSTSSMDDSELDIQLILNSSESDPRNNDELIRDGRELYEEIGLIVCKSFVDLNGHTNSIVLVDPNHHMSINSSSYINNTVKNYIREKNLDILI